MKRALSVVGEHRLRSRALAVGVISLEARLNQQASHGEKLLFTGLGVDAKSITIALAEGARKDCVHAADGGDSLEGEEQEGAGNLARIHWAKIAFVRLRCAPAVHRQPYDEEKAFKTSAASTARRIKHLHNQAQTLGFKLVPA